MADKGGFGPKISRRTFLKVSGTAGLVGSFYFIFGYQESDAHSMGWGKPWSDLVWGTEVATVCCYCSVGCGAICCVEAGDVVAVLGDPDHPINEGALCSKGASMLNLRNVYYDIGTRVLNPKRLTKVLYRAPYSTSWETKTWDWAIEQIADRVKDLRDATFEEMDGSVTVNRTKAIAHWGSAAIDNEENYLMHKLMRALGVINLDHHARL